MYLGIEIGGTKLQLGVGDGKSAELAELVRHDVDSQRGAAGILEQIERTGASLIRKHDIERIGIGFGGPVDSAAGITTKSHQVEGWENFPLAQWCLESLGKPAVIGNDCDCAALAEARHGAGRGAKIVFYVTVGTGIGGGLVVEGRLHGSGRPAAAEIGHLRPGPMAREPELTVERMASGPGIAALAERRVTCFEDHEQAGAKDLMARCHRDFSQLTAKLVAEAAVDGNELARDILFQSYRYLGWAVAQVITLIAPEVVVIGGGVSLIGEEFFFQPLREVVPGYVFPPLASSYRIVPAGLGELAVVHGAIALAAGAQQ
jgi:glucokinase